jgi:hypothetical protein
MACFAMQELLEHFEVDDASDASPVHLGGGLWGAPPTSAPGLGSPLPHWDWAHPVQLYADELRVRRRHGLAPTAVLSAAR